MNRNKKIFIAFAVVFFIIVLTVSYDISQRTTFPGSKPQLKERIEGEYLKDSADIKDTLQKQN